MEYLKAGERRKQVDTGEQETHTSAHHVACSGQQRRFSVSFTIVKKEQNSEESHSKASLRIQRRDFSPKTLHSSWRKKAKRYFNNDIVQSPLCWVFSWQWGTTPESLIKGYLGDPSTSHAKSRWEGICIQHSARSVNLVSARSLGWTGNRCDRCDESMHAHWTGTKLEHILLCTCCIFSALNVEVGAKGERGSEGTVCCSSRTQAIGSLESLLWLWVGTLSKAVKV